VTRIDDLIARLCPTGVEFKTLGEVGEFIRGNGIQKKDFTESGIGCIHYGQIHTHYGTWATETKTYVSPQLANRLRKARTGDLVIATTSEDDEAVGKAVAWLGSEAVAVSSDAYIFRHSLDPKYVAYFFQSDQFQLQKIRHVTGTKVRRIAGERLATIRIPAPPLEVQREIVRVLDLFTGLEAELEAELEARRRQYAHYRDTLLAFSHSKSVRWVTLGDLFQMRAGGHVPASSISNSCNDARPVPCYGGNGIRGYVAIASHNSAHLLVGRQGALCGNVQRTTGRFFATEHAVVLSPTPAVNIDWAFHMLTIMNLNQFATRSAQPGLAVGNLLRLRITLPPLDEQQRIASILDNFDALVNDLSIGLPAELAARRKQYEYYRDRLLTFEEAAA